MNHEGHKGHEGNLKEGFEVRDFEPIGRSILDACYAVHTQLGAGLLESVYETCLAIEFEQRGIRFQRQVELPLVYKGIKIESAYKLDFLVDDTVVVELKAVNELLPVHEAQLMTYMKLNKTKLGYLINFNTVHLRNGVKRFVL